MAREIFVLDSKKQEGSGNVVATLVFWLVAPVNRVDPAPNASPGIPPSTAVDSVNGVSWGYTAAELAAVRSGSVVVQTVPLDSGEITGAVTLASMQAAADAKFAAAQAALNNSALTIKTVGMARAAGVWGAAP
jgi:hypothetical protein